LCKTVAAIDKDKAFEVLGATRANEPPVYQGKAEMVGYFERFHKLCNVLGVCHFTTTWLDAALQLSHQKMYGRPGPETSS